MLIWRLMAAVFAISAAFQFVYASYFVPGKGNVSAIDLVIVKDLPLYKGVWSYGTHGVAPVSKLMS